MIEEWNRYKGWSILEYFLLYPNIKIHLNALARVLGVGTSTAQRFCTMYAKDGLLSMERVGNVCQYSLVESNSRVHALKLFMGPYLIADNLHLGQFLKKNKTALSISIYGSFASGDYGDKSDLDVLILTADETKPRTEDLANLELKLGREISTTSFSLAKWRGMERKNDRFLISVKKNNVLVWGNPV